MNMEGTAVLLSIRPEWCQKIFRGEKTMEIRKSFPKDFQGQPFKCFIDGKFGAFQEKVKTSAGGIDLEAWQLGAASDLPPEVTAQIQREHVTDWLLGNFDAHGENFLTDQEGRIVGMLV